METQFSDVNRISLRSIARHAVLDALSIYSRTSGKMDQSLRANRVQFLYFHHVFRDEEENFRKLLSTFSKTHCFISYSEGVERIRSGNIDKPYLTVSFDDGIKNCMRATNIMDELGIKGCFFVCPGVVGEHDPVKIAAFTKTIGMPPIDYLDWDDIEVMLKNGHEIGGHTMSHSNLALDSREKLEEEIGGSYDVLVRELGSVAHFAWPFGRFSNFSAGAAEVVFGCGYKTCASAERGCHAKKVENPHNFCIRRDHILPSWPLSHIQYLLAQNYQVAGNENGSWPKGW